MELYACETCDATVEVYLTKTKYQRLPGAKLTSKLFKVLHYRGICPQCGSLCKTWGAYRTVD